MQKSVVKPRTSSLKSLATVAREEDSGGIVAVNGASGTPDELLAQLEATGELSVAVERLVPSRPRPQSGSQQFRIRENGVLQQRLRNFCKFLRLERSRIVHNF